MHPAVILGGTTMNNQAGTEISPLGSELHLSCGFCLCMRLLTNAEGYKTQLSVTAAREMRRKRKKTKTGQWKASRFKWMPSIPPPHSCLAASFHLTPQCLRIKMTTHLKKCPDTHPIGALCWKV